MLAKKLGLLDIYSIATGTMIGSGLFVLPGLAFKEAGPAAIVSYGLAALLMLPSMLSQAELATAMPRSGGSYFFIERSLGALMGTLAGLTNWLAISLKATFALFGVGAMVQWAIPELGEWGIRLTGIGCCLALTALNLVSVKRTGRLQTLLGLALLATLAVYAGVGYSSIEPSHYQPFLPKGIQAMLAVAGLVFVSYGGLTKVVDVAEEIHRPDRNIPLGLFLSFFTVSVAYVLVVFVTIGVLEPGRLAETQAPLAQAARSAMGPVVTLIVSTGGALAFFTTANAGILSASRSPMAMSRDGLLPELLCTINRRYGTPHAAIMATAGFMVLVLAFLSVENLVKAASTMFILMLTMANLSVIVMRFSGLLGYRPSFRAPLFPWLQGAAIVLYVLLILEMGKLPLVITGLVALVAVGWYLAYVRPRVDRESAFVFLVKRIASKGIIRRELDRELQHIALERDGMVPDWFDELARHCPVLDIEDPVSMKDVLRRAADALADRVHIPPDQLYEMLLSRERESSTVVQPEIAIPHVLVDGENIFDMLLLRCRAGATFSELNPPVRAGFVLIGSADQRNRHLRALMKVAHIVQEQDFKTRWMQARDAEGLRHIVLLSARQREIPRRAAQVGDRAGPQA